MDASYAFPDAKKDSSSTRRFDELPKAIDLSHHLNLLSRSRGANSLKSLYKYMQQPGMISLAGGMPHYEIFPFQSISAEIYPADALAKKPPTSSSTPSTETSTSLKPPGLLSWLLGSKSTKTVTVPKTSEALHDPNAVDLATLLQYSSSEGHPALRAFIREFVEKVYQPGYADWQVQLTLGTTGGWAQVVNMLLERGDCVLVEEFTYPGAINAWQPLGCRQVAVKMDGEGLLPDDLERILANWDEKKEGVRRPRLLYTVPTGQNPTGGTMFGDRKKRIYDICVKYDVIIGEDEPYYFLYADPWIPQGQKTGQSARADLHAAMKSGDKKGVEDFFKQLPPSYLKYDYQGRVIRMDTFSKTIAPGVRLGWFTTNPLFTERLLRGCEGTYGSPNGIGQAMIAKLLIDWGYDGYIRWLRGIKATYAMRRDWMCDILESTFHLEFDQVLPISNSIRWITAYEKLPQPTSISTSEKGFTSEKGIVKSRKALVSFVPPSAGMFVWLAVHLENHPDYRKLKAQGEDASRVLIEKLWIQLAENNVLISPGFFFEGEKGMVHEGAENLGFYRLAFSNASKEQMEKSIKTIYHTFVQFFKE